MVAAGKPVLLVRKISVLPDSGVFEADAAKVLRIVGGRVEAVEHHALIANQPIGAVRGVRVDPSRIHVRLGAGAHVNTDYYEARQQINRTLLSAHFRSIPRIHFVNRNQRTEHKRVSPPISVPKSGTLPLNRFDLSRLARRS